MNVMKKAWEIAKAAVAKFGGKAREYFSFALKEAWAIKKGKAIEMAGSEKQIKWANDIKAKIESQIPKTEKYLLDLVEKRTKLSEEEKGLASGGIKKIAERVKSRFAEFDSHAKNWIDFWIGNKSDAYFAVDKIWREEAEVVKEELKAARKI